MYCYITLIRDALLWGQTPTLVLVARCVVLAALSLLLGMWAFRKHEHKFILYI